ncbi:MAG: type II secretion system protein [Planctomycetota bacterium]|jgi:prepilin-type N-terminal cleavage/methylation domain-containing protein
MKRLQNNNAFTLIELLVVIAIIALLMAVLNASVRKVKIVSKNLRQKAAFHAGEISLELYSRDFGDYPDSSRIPGIDGTYVTGAQRLAEALFGRDDQGFHPKSKWHPAEDMAGTMPHPGPDLYTNNTLKDRKKPYFERKRVGFYTINDLWGSSGFGPSQIYTSAGAGIGTQMSPVFTDVFAQNKVIINGENEKVGMPILYFKADRTKEDFRTFSHGDWSREGKKIVVPLDQVDSEIYKYWTYNFDDNINILDLPWLRDPTDPDKETGDIEPHYQDPEINNPAGAFYKLITQREDEAMSFYRPHNAETFIFVSAGYDGIYGTKDDLTNFDY